MLFITNRHPKQKIRLKLRRKFDFDLDDNAASNAVFCCEREGSGIYQELGIDDFFSQVRGAKYRQLLVYIHGSSNLPEDAFIAAEEFQYLCNKKKKDEVLVVPLIWPCDNDLGVVKDWWDDQKSADMSGFSISRLLENLAAWRYQYNPDDNPCLKRINVLAHSMGSRVLRETLAAWNKYDLSSGVPLVFRNTFLVAADMDNGTLQVKERGVYICDASRNVIVYHATDDLALRASIFGSLKEKISSRRLGHTGPQDMNRVPRNVYAIDCDDVNNIYDVPKGHSYYRSGTRKGKPGKVFDHIFATLMSGRVFPDDEFKRTSIITRE